MICPNCGNECSGKFCTKCGTRLDQPAAGQVQYHSGNNNNNGDYQQQYQQSVGQQYQQQYQQPVGQQYQQPLQQELVLQQPAQQNSRQTGSQNKNPTFGIQDTEGVQIPPEYQPISMWGYFGYTILFAIPCLGIILAMVMATKSTKNVNVRNFARSQFCWILIILVLVLMFIGSVGGLGALSRY